MCNPKQDLCGLKNWRFARDTLCETKHPIFTPLSKTTCIPVCFIWKSPPPVGTSYRNLKTDLWKKQIFKIQTIFHTKPAFVLYLRKTKSANSDVMHNTIAKIVFRFSLFWPEVRLCYTCSKNQVRSQKYRKTYFFGSFMLLITAIANMFSLRTCTFWKWWN